MNKHVQNPPGRHCCLWCLIPQTQLKVPLSQRGRFPSRSLDLLRADHERFLASGGNLKDAKLYNNSIGIPLLSIPLEKVNYVQVLI